MTKTLCNNVTGMQPSLIRKYFDIVARMNSDRIISLGIGEPDFHTPPYISDAGIKSIHGGKTFYTPNAGIPELRQEIAGFMKKHYNLKYDPANEIIVTVGATEGIDGAFRTLLNYGDEVLIPEPAFVQYDPCVRMAGGIPVPINLSGDNDFKLTARQIEEKITDNTKALLLSYPSNPTGAIMTEKDLAGIVDVIIKNDLYVISDEIYSELTYAGKHVSIASFKGMRERTLVCNGFSKTYAMTGWRLGYIAGPAEIITHTMKVHQFAVTSASTASQYAGVEAIRNGEDDIVFMRGEYDRKRKYILERFEKMGLPCFEGQGAFYLMPYVGCFGMDGEEFADRLLQEQLVAVVPGRAFGESGRDYIRIAYPISMEKLEEAMDRMETFVNSLTRTDR